MTQIAGSLVGGEALAIGDKIIGGISGKILSVDANKKLTQITGGAGTTDHAALSHLDFASSGHTGFVPYTGATTNLTLGVHGLTAGSITDSGLTSGRVPYASTAGLLVDSANLRFDGSSLFLDKSPIDTGLAGQLFMTLSGSVTDNATLYHYGIRTGVSEKIADGKTDSGRLQGINLNALRNYGTTSDNGTLAELYGTYFQYGHYYSDVTATPITTTTYGIRMAAQCYYGTMGTVYDIAIVQGGSIVPTTRYGLYINGLTGTTLYDIYAGDSGAKNYFAGNVGIGTTSPTQPLQVEGSNGSTVVTGQYIGFKSGAGDYKYIGSVGGNRLGVVGAKLEMGSGAGSNFYTTYNANTDLQIYPYTSGYNILLNPTSGNVGIGTTSPTAALHLKAGTATANTAPLKFTSGTLNTTAESGAVEFLTDDFYGTITTGAARKAFILDDGTRLTSGKVPVATTNGRLIDSSGVSGSFTTVDLKTVTVTNGLITAIV